MGSGRDTKKKAHNIFMSEGKSPAAAGSLSYLRGQKQAVSLDDC